MTGRRKLDELERVEIFSIDELHRWLVENAEQAESIWLVTFKKLRPERHVGYDAVVDEAICHGWIDSLPRKLDAERSMLLLSPRRRGSAWSAVNKARVARLEAAGRMRSRGQAVVAQAQRDGSWDFLNDVDALIEPADLATRLDADPAARDHFDAFSHSSRRGILEWIKQAKRPETRARRIAATAALAAKGIKANH